MKKGSTAVTAFVIIALFVMVAALGIYFAKSKTEKNSENTNTTAANENGNGTVAGTREIISTSDADIMIFYGSTCPHCKKVNEFIIANDIDKVVPLQHLEVYSNKTNASLMTEKLNACKDLSDDDKGGVPFMYAKDKCLVGDQPIIEYLKEKAGI